MNHGTVTFLNSEILIVIIVVIIGFFLSLELIFNYLSFKSDRNYIKMEMSRSSNEKEFLFWERQLKKLYLSYIPIIGRFFR